jgi:hypothetical protein
MRATPVQMQNRIQLVIDAVRGHEPDRAKTIIIDAALAGLITRDDAHALIIRLNLQHA